MARFYVGTSGWTYPRWAATFYAGVPRRDWLRYAASRFTALEINATFYGLQRRSTFERWRDETPPDFAFALKANRYLTHNRKLREPAEPIRRERERAEALGPKLKAVLWQLPEALRADLDRLRAFLDALAAGWPRVPHAIEFRHRSWFADAVADELRARDIAVCISDAADWPMWDAVTARIVYVRLHGHTRTYASAYHPRALRRWAARARRWAAEGRDVHIYFDNDAEGAAPYDALRLLAFLGVRTPGSAPPDRRGTSRYERAARPAGTPPPARGLPEYFCERDRR